MSAKKPLRVGVIGAGAIAQTCHVPGYAQSTECELVAFADPDEDRHREMAKLHPGMTAYTDHKAMLKTEALDVVSVCSPNVYHAAQTVDALKSGCHVLCEKPMATTLKDADKMIEAAKKARKKLMIGFTHRLMKGPARCKEVLKDRSLGKAFMIRVRFAHGGPYPGWAKSNWFYDPKLAAGGALLDMGIHAIDLCLWLMGPVRSVTARASALIRKLEVDDNAVVLLEFKHGAYGYIDVGWTSKPGFTGLEIYATNGSIICDYRRGMQMLDGTASAGGDNTAEWTELEPEPAQGGWDIEIAHWLDVVAGREKLTMDGTAGRNALEVALAAYKSSETGKQVTLGTG